MRGLDPGKDEKTRKTPEKPSGKVLIWDTFEQYAGLISSAASRFSHKNIKKTRKHENRPFCHFEQYAGLEVPALPELVDSGGQE